jgi:hypothetical protein
VVFSDSSFFKSIYMIVMKTNISESPVKIIRGFTTWKGSLNRLGATILMLSVFLFSSNSSKAYISYSEDFEGGPAGWTGTFVWTGADVCAGNYAMMDDFSSTDLTGNLNSPFIGFNFAGNHAIMLSFDYKVVDGLIGAPANFGTIQVQYASNSGGPWTTVYTIDSQNHVVSASCEKVHVPLFYPGITNLYFRFLVTWANGTFDVIIDNLLVGNVCLDENFLKACWGVFAPHTFYYGLSQWYWIKAKVAGGNVGTYIWTTSSSGSIKPSGNGDYAVYLFEPTGPTVVTLNISFSPTCYYILDFPIAWDNQYFAYKVGNTIYVKICENGISKDVAWSEARTKVCGGLATLGYCTPKTDLVSSEILTMEVFPNPTNGELMINLANSQSNSTISIYDLNSNIVLFENIETVEGQFSKVFDLSYLPNGLYFIQLNDGKAILTEKVVISH